MIPTPRAHRDGDQATAAIIDTEYTGSIAVDPTGVVYLADTGNHVIRRNGIDGVITVIAGTGIAGTSTDGVGRRPVHHGQQRLPGPRRDAVVSPRRGSA